MGFEVLLTLRPSVFGSPPFFFLVETPKLIVATREKPKFIVLSLLQTDTFLFPPGHKYIINHPKMLESLACPPLFFACHH